MRKFWIVLLSLGLIMAFAMPAWSADAKFSGSYYVVGYHESNHSLKDDAARKTDASFKGETANFFAQRLRIQPEFKIKEGLTLVTRFDALEKKWGDQTWSPSASYDVTNRISTGVANVRTQENIEWERAYVDFTTGIGRFLVGYQNFMAWGTSFADTHITRPGIKYLLPIGDLTIVAAWEKVGEGSSTGTGTGQKNLFSEHDYNIYDLGVMGKFKGGEWGVLVLHAHNTLTDDAGMATGPAAAAGGGWKRSVFYVDPYVKATFGPVYIEAEAGYGWGDWYDYEGTTRDVDLKAIGIYVNAKVDLAPAYVGIKFAWVRGDDPNTANEVEGNVMASLLAGQVFNPCLMMFNDDLNTYLGSYNGYATGTNQPMTNFFDNAWLYQIYGGFKFTPKLELYASLSMAKADEKPAAGWVDTDFGTEFDVTLTYKIFDNLSYMIGGGYWWVGDYFKGTSATNKIDDTYLLMHKLILTF